MNFNQADETKVFCIVLGLDRYSAELYNVSVHWRLVSVMDWRWTTAIIVFIDQSAVASCVVVYWWVLCGCLCYWDVILYYLLLINLFLRLHCAVWWVHECVKWNYTERISEELLDEGEDRKEESEKGEREKFNLRLKNEALESVAAIKPLPTFLSVSL